MLSSNARKALEIACPQTHSSKGIGADGSDGAEIANAIDTGFNATPAADVPANSPAGAVTVSADTIALSTSNTYSDSAVNTAVNTALSSVATKENAAIASVIADINSTRTQINAILSALKAAGLMS